MAFDIFRRAINWLKRTTGAAHSKNIAEDRQSEENLFLPDSETKGQRTRSRDRKPAQIPGNKNIRKPAGDTKPRKDDAHRQRQNQAPAARQTEETPRKQSGEPRRKRQHARQKPASRKNTSMAGWQPPAAPENIGDGTSFQELGLDNRILRAVIDDLGFVKCSPIQAQSLPLSLAGKDVAGKAQTGTGKTAAFLISILQKFLKGDKSLREPWQPMGIVLAPTRELALQIAEDAEALSTYCEGFKIVAVFGGMDYARQMEELASGVDLVVATPGRLKDYLGRHAVDFSATEMVVIDEADRMLDMGFIPDVKRIMSYLPPPDKRQTMLFSATLTQDILNLAARWMRESREVVQVEPEHVLAEGIDETVFAVTTSEKLAVILWLFAHEDCHRVIIFRNRKKDVEELHYVLNKCGIQSEMLTGDVEQRKRMKILDDFKAGIVKIIVATDVAGRGIHVDDVTHVINYDLPYEAEDYVHRVGRTARAGHRGRAISFADEDCAFVIPEIEKVIERPLPITQPEDEMLVLPAKLKDIKSPGTGGFSRGGNSGGYRSGGRRPGGSNRSAGQRVRRGGPRN